MSGSPLPLIAKRAPQFLDDAGDGGIGDKRVGPQTAMQFVFRHDSWRLFDEGGEQVERLAREVHTPAVTADEAPPCVQRESMESHDWVDRSRPRIISGMFVCPAHALEFPPILPRLTGALTRKLANTRETCWPSSRQHQSFSVRTFDRRTRSSAAALHRRPSQLRGHSPAGRRHRRLGCDRLSRERRLPKARRGLPDGQRAVDPMSDTCGSTSSLPIGLGKPGGWHKDDLSVAIAHELQHAVEIAGWPDVVDGATLQAAYTRRGLDRGGSALGHRRRDPSW